MHQLSSFLILCFRTSTKQEKQLKYHKIQELPHNICNINICELIYISLNTCSISQYLFLQNISSYFPFSFSFSSLFLLNFLSFLSFLGFNMLRFLYSLIFAFPKWNMKCICVCACACIYTYIYSSHKFAGDLDRRRSLSSYMFSISRCLVSWKSTL